jgi:hypothetical protein
VTSHPYPPSLSAVDMRRLSLAAQSPHRERDLVRHLCLTGEKTALETLAPESLDWDKVVRYALHHGLAPLFWQGLRRACDGNGGSSPGPDGVLGPSRNPWMSPALFKNLRDSYLSTLRRNLLRQTALLELDGALAGTGITCLLWKGSALCIDVYGHPALRPMDDVDLLIPSGDLKGFKGVAGRLGFKAMSRYPLAWVRGEVTLDLHSDAVHSDRIPGRLLALPLTAEVLAQEARRIGSFRHLRTLSPRDTLITLAVHGMKHGFSRDIWLADALFLIEGHPSLLRDPRALIRRAEATGAAKALYLFLSLVSTCGPGGASALLANLPPHRPGLLSRRFMACFLAGHPVPHVGDLFFSTLIASPRKRIAFLKDVVFPSRRVIDQVFPLRGSRPYWPFYVLRIVRLILAGARVLATLALPPGRKAC